MRIDFILEIHLIKLKDTLTKEELQGYADGFLDGFNLVTNMDQPIPREYESRYYYTQYGLGIKNRIDIGLTA